MGRKESQLTKGFEEQKEPGEQAESQGSTGALAQWGWAGQNYRSPFSRSHDAEGAREPSKQVWLWSGPWQVPVLSVALCTSPPLKHPGSRKDRKPQAQEEEAGALIRAKIRSWGEQACRR